MIAIAENYQHHIGAGEDPRHSQSDLVALLRCHGTNLHTEGQIAELPAIPMESRIDPCRKNLGLSDSPITLQSKRAAEMCARCIGE
jgi:hypothetical protein